MFTPQINNCRAIRHKFTCLACALLLATSVQALTDLPPADNHTTLIAGSEQSNPPFSTGMTDVSADGFTVELWRAVAAEAGLKYTLRVQPSQQLIEDFKAGKIDVLINLSQSSEHRNFAAFTIPHVVLHGAIFVRDGTTGIRTEADLAGKSLIVLKDDPANAYAVSKGWQKQLVQVDTAAEGLRLLSSGMHDAMLLPKLTGLQTSQTLRINNIRALNIKVGFSQKFSFAVHDGQTELLGKINEALAIVKSSGTYNALYDKWFGGFEPKEAGLHELLVYLFPVILIILGIAGYFFHARKLERQAAEKKYRDLYDHAPDMLLSVSFKTRAILDCNQTLLNTTGYLREELIGRSVLELYHPDCRETLQRAFQKFVSDKEVHGVELQLRRRDGSKLDVSWSATAVCDRNGELLYSRSALHDITERKAAEASIAESRNLLLAIIDTAPIRVFWKDQQLRYMGCNTAFARDAGMSHPEDVVGKNDFQMGWTAEAELYRADDRKVMESGIPKLFYDEPQTTPDGRTIWLRTSKVPLKNKQFETIGVLGIYEDITEHKLAEQKLRTLYTVVEQSPISVIVTNADARIEYVNPHFSAVTGYSEQDAIGQNPSMLQSGLTPRHTYPELWNEISNGRGWHGELINRRKNGEIYWDETHIAPVRNENGALTHFVGVKIDITQRKKIEEALKESEQRYHFMFNNNPLPMWVFREDDLKFLMVNDRAVEHYGYTQEEFQNMTLADIQPGENNTLRMIADSPDGKIERECRHKTRDGKQIDVLISTMPMKYGDTPARIMLIQDITTRKQLESAREELLNRLQKITSQLPGVVYQFLLRPDGSSCFPFASPAIREIYHVSPEEVREDASKVFACLHPDDYDGIVNSIRKSAETLSPWHHEYRVQFDDGTVNWLLGSALPQREADGSILWHGFITDISRRKQNENALKHSEERFRFMLENSPIAVRIANIAKSQVVFTNQRYAELIDSPPEHAIGIDPKQYYANPQEYADVIEQISNGKRVTNRLIELIIPGPHSKTKWALASYLQLEFQGEPAVLGWFYDITDRKTMEEQIQHLAHFDPLTDLPNRTLFTDRLHQALTVARRDKNRLALMFIDLDKFKPINDTLGHDVGDLILKEAAQRIQSCLRESDTVARIGGDEFVVLLPTIETAQDALGVAEKIRASLNQPFRHANHSLSISSSTGIAIYPEHSSDDKQLFKMADIAMYHAKTSGRDNVKIYRADMLEISQKPD